MKNVKQMLKQMSNEQEIHDVQDNILKNVDMNKVRNQVFIKESHPKRFILLSNIFSAFAAAMIVVLVVLIANGNKDEDNKTLGEDIVEPTDNELPNFEDNFVVFTQYLKNMQKQEAYNIINIVPSIGNIEFKEVTLNTETKRMTNSEMEALADDVNSQIYNIEEMLGITSVSCEKSNNTYYGIEGNKYSTYENKISVSGPLYPYHLYFTEQNVTEQNVGKTNFKSNSNIFGLIDTVDNTYEFHGNKIYKNSKTTYETLVDLNDYKIDVKEVFGTDSNEFTYKFYKESEIIKEINIEQKFDKDGNVRALSFKNQYTSINIEKKNVPSDTTDGYTIVFKVDSRDGDTLTITKNETNYSYQFGNNKEIVYTR